jgi:hypothetical protein
MYQTAEQALAEAVSPKKRYRRVGRIDARRKVARRSVQLARHYAGLLEKAGRDTAAPEMLVAIMAAGELIALVEDARAKMLRGDHVPLDSFTALQRLADQSVARLGLLPSRTPAPEPERGLTLAEYLANRGAE